MSRGLKMTPSINSFLNPSTIFNPSLKPCCANSFTSRSRTLPQCARSLEALASVSLQLSNRQYSTLFHFVLHASGKRGSRSSQIALLYLDRAIGDEDAGRRLLKPS